MYFVIQVDVNGNGLNCSSCNLKLLKDFEANVI